MSSRLVLGVLAILGASVSLLGQTAERQEAQPSQAPVFRSGADLVRLDVRATDEDGRTITDLRADEIEVYEEGSQRPVLLFQRVAQPLGTYLEAAQRTISAEVSTNQGSPRGNVYVLVFDQTHIAPGNEQRARLAAQRFLQTRVRPGDRVALYALPGPGPQIDFTSDVSRPSQELISIRGSWEEAARGNVSTMRIHEAYEITRGNSEILTRVADRLADSTAGTDVTAVTNRPVQMRESEDAAVLRRLVSEDARTLVARADSESRQFLLMLADVVASLRAVEGRKSVILFSEGFPVDNVGPELLRVAAAAAQSYCVVYALDLNQRLTSAADEAPRGGEIASEIQSRLQVLGSLTAETDGVLFTDASPQLDRIMNRISEASQDYYLVGFEPSDTAARDRGSYRRVRVVVKRPGVRVSTRSGYSMAPEGKGLNQRQAIEAAMRAPFSQQGLKVEYTTYVLRGATTSDVQRVVLSLAAELPVATASARTAEVVFGVRDVATGKVAAAGADTIPLPEAARPGATTGTSVYRVQFEVPPGNYLMRAVVREPGGLLGSADRRFQVRALGGPGVTAGDLVIASAEAQGLPVRATLYPSDALAGVLEIYGRTQAQVDGVTVDVSLLPLGSTTAVTSGRADLQEVKSSPAGWSRGAVIDLPLEGVPPGEYVVQAVVRTGSDTEAELLRDVTILPGSRPARAAAAPAAAIDPHVLIDGELFQQQVAKAQKLAGAGPMAPAAAAAARGAWDEADRRMASLDDSMPGTLLLKGLTRFARRDYAGAAEALKGSTVAQPGDAGTAFLLGWAQRAQGDERAAIGAWRAATVADPSLVPAYLALVDAYLGLGQPQLALQVVRSGLEVLPDSPELRDRLARLERE